MLTLYAFDFMGLLQPTRILVPLRLDCGARDCRAATARERRA